MKNITSLATPPINGAIHIIRMTGPNVFEIINKISSKIIERKGHTIKKTNLIQGNKIIDQVLLMLYVGPNSYTGEDLIEINSHGNILIANQILNLLLVNGCEIAKRGEFTKIAFLNNKIDISQAISINQISTTPSLLVKDISMNNLLGKAKNIFKDWRDKIFNIIGNIEVSIDYPEYDDIEEISIRKIMKISQEINLMCKQIIENYLKYKFIFNGIDVAIIGKPNVGKSTLLNKLLSNDRAIVSDMSGTTRDYIKESIINNGIKYNLIDTAGIRKSSNKIEKMGISKTEEILNSASIIIYVVDGSKTLEKADYDILEKIKNKNFIKVNSKKDLGKFYKNVSEISIGKNDAPDLIFSEIEKNLKINNLEYDNIFISSQIEFNFLLSIKNYCEEIIEILKNNAPIDLAIEVIKLLFEDIKSLLGESLNYEIIDEIFDNFCLGK